MDTVMGVDPQDLVSKMEGFAVQGIQGMSTQHIIICIPTHYIQSLGAASNHRQRVSQVHAKIRNMVNSKLCRSAICV